MSLFSELQRRNVFKVAAAYVVVGWLVMQAGDLLAPQLSLPEWAPRLVTFLVLIGFPIALVLAWIFDLTPDGMQLAQGRVGNTRFYASVGAITVLALGWFFMGQREDPATQMAIPGPAAEAVTVSEAPPSIAVLPFVNMSPDPENEYFADGIAEELLNILAGIDGLKVASRTSAFSFKGSNASLPTIAATLNVAHVLEGSVRKQGDRVRITAQLIHADSDTHLWSETFDRQLIDIFKVQEEIAQSITTALEGVLGTQKVAVAAVTRDLEAYQRFLRGRTRFYQRVDLDDALADFQFAVGRDPDFAEAWAFLAATAQVHSLSGYPTQLDRNAIMQLVDPAVDRALALNSDLPLLLAVQGYRLMDTGVAEIMLQGIALMERAAESELSDSTARMWLGLFWLTLGQIDRATAVLESAFLSDPLVAINVGYLGLARFLSGQEAEGERLARRAVELSGWFATAWMISVEMANRGQFASATEWYVLGPARATLSEADIPRVAEGYARALGDPGSRSSYASMLQSLGAPPNFGTVQHMLAMADVETLFDRIQADGTWLEHLSMNLAAWLPSLGWLREDPRYFALMLARGHVGVWEVVGYPLDCRPVDDPAGRRLECGD